jgi:hypothetical protein
LKHAVDFCDDAFAHFGKVLRGVLTGIVGGIDHYEPVFAVFGCVGLNVF